MGTRGFVILKYKNKYYAMYNHFDSYFNHLGVNLVSEIQKAIKDGTFDNWKVLLEQCKKIQENSECQVEQKDIDNLIDYMDLTVSGCSNYDWYCLTRKLQGSFIKPLTVGYMLIKPDSDKCEYCDIFIEYTYLLDLDNNTFKVSNCYGKNVFDVFSIPEDWYNDKYY